MGTDTELEETIVYIEQLMKSPREIPPPDVEIVESEELGRLYRQFKTEIHEELKERPNAPELTPEEKAKLSEKIPPCIAHILTAMPPKSAKVDYNRLVMHVASYFLMVGWNKADVWAKVQPFVEGYPHSATYDTPESRLAHWRAQWAFLEGNEHYRFDCSFIKGLGLPGSAFDCKSCVGKEEALPALTTGETTSARFLETSPLERRYIFADLLPEELY
jgi:hypothetical protein